MPIGERRIVFKHRQNVVGVQDEFWFKAVGAEWTVAYRVLQHDGYPVLGELRLYPSETSNRGTGRWSGRIGSVPVGGITTRLLRSLQLGSDVVKGLKEANRYARLVPGARESFKRAGFRRLKRAPRKGQGWPDDVLLEAARFYVERGGRRPVADLAEAWKVKHTQARDMLQAATDKGFLTAGTQGKTSRALTDKAKARLTEKEPGQ